MHLVTKCPVCGNQQLIPYLTARDFSLSEEEFRIQACKDCEFLITSPRPELHQLTKYYQSLDYISHAVRPTNIINQLFLLARHYTLHHKIRMVNHFASRGNLLDFGCGTGDFLKVSSKMGWTAYGVEPAETARKLASKTNNLIFDDIASCPNNSFTAITLWHVLEHVPDINATIEELKKRLSNDGTIFIAVPNFRSHDSQHYTTYWAGFDVPRHLWHFSQKAMIKFLTNHKLKGIKTIPMRLDSYYVSLLSEKYIHAGKLSPSSFYRALKVAYHSNRLARKSTEFSSLIYVVTK
jgi:2-polyprenyl-3-methyl-5-hydroxy-6-metoxy-1,4-benzoquinol methylase